MAYSTDLFDLIKSLSRTEKAYIKKYAYKQGKGGENAYLKLFDAIDKQKIYDEEKLKKKFRNTSITKQFSAAKNYLYSLILSSLCDYNQAKSPQLQLLQQMKEVIVLRKKDLNIATLKKIRSAKSLAEELYRLPFKYFLTAIELNCTRDLNMTGLDVVREELTSQGEQIYQEAQMRSLFDKVIELNFEIGKSTRKEAYTKQLRQVLEHPLMKYLSEDSSFPTKVLRLDIYCRVYRLLEERELFLQFAKKRVAQYDERKDKYQLYSYYMALMMVAIAQAELGLVAEFEESIQHVQHIWNTVKIDDNAIKGTLFRLAFNYPFVFYSSILGYDPDKAFTYIPQLREGIKGGLIDVFHSYRTRHNIVQFYFTQAQYAEALDVLNELLSDEPKFEMYRDLYSAIRMLNLISHYELGNELLLDNAVRATYRYLKKMEQVYDFEKTLLKFIKKVVNIAGVKERKAAFAVLKKEIELIKQNELERSVIENSVVSWWIECKVRNISMHQWLLEQKET